MTARSQAEQQEAGRRLDRALQAELGDTTWNDFVAKVRDAGYKLSYETLRAVRAGESKPSRLTKAAIEAGAGWATGSVDDVMDGGKPTHLQAAPQSDPMYDDPALQAIWEIELLDKDEREAAIFAVRVIRERKRGAETARTARA